MTCRLCRTFLTCLSVPREDQGSRSRSPGTLHRKYCISIYSNNSFTILHKCFRKVHSKLKCCCSQRNYKFHTTFFDKKQKKQSMTTCKIATELHLTLKQMECYVFLRLWNENVWLQINETKFLQFTHGLSTWTFFMGY